MIFCLRLKMHTDRASTFHMWLLKAGRQIGVVPTSMTNDSQDMDWAEPDLQVYSFVCQAEAALKPRQMMTLFAECERVGAVVLGIVYQEATVPEEGDGEGDEEWSKLVRTVRRTPKSPAVVHRLRVGPFPEYLQLVWSKPREK